MDEVPLPDRLRYLSERFTVPSRADDVRTAMLAAADELERLARPAPTTEGARALLADLGELAEHLAPSPEFESWDGRDWRAVLLEARAELERLTRLPEPLEVIEPSDVIYALRYGLEHRDYVGTSHDLEIRREALRLLSTAPREPVDPLPDVGEPEPSGRRFAASYLDPHAVGEEPLTFPTPAPGSFVLLGPVGSAWRVLAVDELAGHGTATHVLELEAVDPHDVPVRARVETVPMPVEELDADTLYDPAEVTS